MTKDIIFREVIMAKINQYLSQTKHKPYMNICYKHNFFTDLIYILYENI